MSLGESFARALAAKDGEAVLALLHPDLDFQAMTPRRTWQIEKPADLLDVLGVWFDEGDHIEGIERLETDAFSDRERVGYRLRVRNADGLHLVEQQAYLTELDGKIGWLRIMCAGYRPA